MAAPPWLVDPPRWLRVAAVFLAAWPLMAMLGMMLGELLAEKDTFSLWVVLSVWAAWFALLFDAALSGRAPEGNRRLWVVVLILAHMFALPFYWYFYILRGGIQGNRNRWE